MHGSNATFKEYTPVTQIVYLGPEENSWKKGMLFAHRWFARMYVRDFDELFGAEHVHPTLVVTVLFSCFEQS